MTITEEAPQAVRPMTLLEATLRDMANTQDKHADENALQVTDTVITLTNGERRRGSVQLDPRYPDAVILWETVWTVDHLAGGTRKFPIRDKEACGADGVIFKGTIWHQEYATTIPLTSILMVEWAMTEVD